MIKQFNYNTAVIDQYLEDHHLTKSALCRLSGVPYSTLRCIYENRPTCYAHNLVKLAKYMQVELRDILGW